jgi:hypothetical protein
LLLDILTWAASFEGFRIEVDHSLERLAELRDKGILSEEEFCGPDLGRASVAARC